MDIELKSVITCPQCNHQKEEQLPTDACQYFYTCENCQTRLKPKEGDCCVFCSYGSIPCPPIQGRVKTLNKSSCCQDIGEEQ